MNRKLYIVIKKFEGCMWKGSKCYWIQKQIKPFCIHPWKYTDKLVCPTCYMVINIHLNIYGILRDIICIILVNEVIKIAKKQRFSTYLLDCRCPSRHERRHHGYSQWHSADRVHSDHYQYYSYSHVDDRRCKSCHSDCW